MMSWYGMMFENYLIEFGEFSLNSRNWEKLKKLGNFQKKIVENFEKGLENFCKLKILKKS